MIFKKIKINLMYKISNIFGIIFRQRSYVRILILIILDIFILTSSLLISSVLLSIKNLYYFKSKRWDIETKNSLIIKLPSEKLEKSFQIISKIFYNKEFNFNIIDLRQNNQVILDG